MGGQLGKIRANSIYVVCIGEYDYVLRIEYRRKTLETATKKGLAVKEFKRLDGLFDHYINKRGYMVVDFLYKRGEKRGFYKLRKM